MAISRSGGAAKLAKQVDKEIPLILDQCMPYADNGDPEMIESCLQAFESFVLRCPKEAGEYQQKVGDAALTYLAYDPNYADDDEDAEEDDVEDGMDDDDDDHEETRDDGDDGDDPEEDDDTEDEEGSDEEEEEVDSAN